MNPKFQKGQVVKLINTDKIGVICEDPKAISNQNYYVLFIEGQYKTYSEESLELNENLKVDILSNIKDKNFATYKEFLSYLTYIKVERPLSNNLYAFLSSRTQFEVHQFKPVLKYLQSPYQRLLIADEVGVGKTIEAGIIYTELQSRQNLNKVLIICPSALRYKWQKELRKRFNEDFGLVDSKTLKAFFRSYDRSPTHRGIKGIASFQMLRDETVLQELERLQIPFDLIIIDEAHHMRNEGTRSHSLGRILSTTTDGMVLLSATPLQLGNRDLFNIFSILVPEEFNNFDIFEEHIIPNEYINIALKKLSQNESSTEILSILEKVESTSQRNRFMTNSNYIFCKSTLLKIDITREDRILLHRKLYELNVLSQVYTRTKKKEIDVASPIRDPITIKVDFTEEELKFYNAVSDLFLRLHPGCPPGFLLQMPQRQVASCIPASINYLKDIYTTGVIDISKEDSDEEEEDEVKIKLTKEDVDSIKEILELGERLDGPDSKTKTFLETISSILEEGKIKKIIIFSFFKRTLKYLEKKLIEISVRVKRVDGDVPFEERERIMDEFSNPDGFKILLSSEVGGEGLDMQFCNCMFNYDLPWNPMKIEQRIGRLDRYGQINPKIHIYNFSVKGTIETNIFLRLCNRIGIFERYVGELEPILGEEIKKLTQNVINVNLTDEQQNRLVDQAANVIERKKQELEIFDEQRSKFIGQDNYFTEEITNIQKEERFISANEIINLFENFIQEEFPKSKFSEKDKGLYEIKFSEDLKDMILTYLRLDNQLSQEARDRYYELLESKSFLTTFDYKVANVHPYVEFITLRHPFVKTIIGHYKRKNFKQVTSIEYISTEANLKGKYVFFLFLLEIKSFTKSLTFVPVAIDVNTCTINVSLSEILLKIVSDSKESPPFSCDHIDEIKEKALSYVIERKNKKEEDLRTTNESLINDRIISLEQTYQIRINQIDELIQKYDHNLTENKSKIVIMKQSQKQNITRNFENKKIQLESDKKIIVSHELIAGGLLYVK